MSVKLKIAMASVALGILLFLLTKVVPLIFYTSGEIVQSVFSVINIFVVFGTVPYFISVLKDKNFQSADVQSAENQNTDAKISFLQVLKHLGIRIAAIGVASVLLYFLILGGKTDPMGLGAIYAGLTAGVLSLIGLISDAIITYRKEKASSRFYSNIILLATLAFFLISFMGMS